MQQQIPKGIRHDRLRHTERASHPSLQVQGVAVEEYVASLAVLLPFKARLAATDRLIDEVVYRLYGLTEEEIAVVKTGVIDPAQPQDIRTHFTVEQDL
jgi:hypothetical protein